MPHRPSVEQQQEAESLRILHMLETTDAPLRGVGRARRPPFWRPTPPPITVHIPTREWERHDLAKRAATDTLLRMDMNAAFIGAAASALFAHGELTHTGPLEFDHQRPGYWRIETQTHWSRRDMPHPLGTGRISAVMWLPTPSVTLLRDLTEQGQWAGFDVLETWTTDERCRLTTWVDHVKRIRSEAITSGDAAREKAVKLAYAQAFQLMVKGKKCLAYRPDWQATVRAQLLARTWWTLHRCADLGHGPVAMGRTDAITMRADDVDALHKMNPKLLPIDESRLLLGHFKTLETLRPGGIVEARVPAGHLDGDR